MKQLELGFAIERTSDPAIALNSEIQGILEDQMASMITDVFENGGTRKDDIANTEK